MKSKWSSAWNASKQPRKQRKYRHNAPLHIRHHFVAAHLAKELRATYQKRSMPLRKGDEVEIMRGPMAGIRKVVERVDLRRSKVYVEGVKVKKVNGTEVLRALQPSNLQITKINLDDKARLAAIQRVKTNAAAPKQPVK